LMSSYGGTWVAERLLLSKNENEHIYYFADF
jgi:hypothetical protein